MRRWVVAAAFTILLTCWSIAAPRSGAQSPAVWRPVDVSRFTPLPSPTELLNGASQPSVLGPDSSLVLLPSASPRGRSPASTPRPKVATPQPRAGHGTLLIKGLATRWPAHGGAAGALLAKAMGGGYKYLGKTIRVWLVEDGKTTKLHVDVLLVTSCGCGDRHGEHTVLDLPNWAFAQLADLGRGVIHVRIERLP